MKIIAVTLLSVLLLGSASACGTGDVRIDDYQLQKSPSGGSTGNGEKCFWGPASGAASPTSAHEIQYDVGASVPSPSGCNTCVCTAKGVACTTRVCAVACKYDSKDYGSGDTFASTDGCNQCSCQDDGSVACTEMACAASVCKYNGKEYKAGETIKDMDGCTECTCGPDGSITSCTDRACVGKCYYDGRTYSTGNHYVDRCCNICTCQAAGTFECIGDPCGSGWRKDCK